VIPSVVESLKDTCWTVHEAAIQCLAGLGAQGMHCLLPIKSAGPLKLVSSRVSARDAGSISPSRGITEGSWLACSSECDSMLGWPRSRRYASSCYPGAYRSPESGLVTGFQQEIRAVIPSLVETLKDSESDVRQAAIESLSGVGEQGLCPLVA
jgi:hypothetical protein